MNNDSETVREVCAEIETCADIALKSGSVFLPREVSSHFERVISAHEREIEKKDAEIARLRSVIEKFESNDIVCDGEAKFIRRDNEYLKKRNELLERALKPMMECKKEHWVIKPENDLAQFRQNATEIFKYESDCVNAVREAQRIMKEGEDND